MKVYFFNLVRFEKLGYQCYSSNLKLVFVKQRMLDWPAKYGKITSHSNLGPGFSKKPWDVTRGFLFQFGVIWEVRLPQVII